MRQPLLSLGLPALLLTACGGETAPPGPLEITAISPAPGATGVETGAAIKIVFNQAIDSITLNAASVVVKAGGVAVATALRYDAATHTVRVAAPLLPDSSYQFELTTDVRTPSGAPLGTGMQWSFSTRPWQAVTVDAAGDVGSASSLHLDGSGRVHVSYLDGTNLDLKYATCAVTCATPANWHVVTVDATGNVGYSSSLAVDASRRVHVSYVDSTNHYLKYATCAAACATSANWQIGEPIDVLAPGSRGSSHYTSLAVDGGGRLYLSYLMLSYFNYARCPAACATSASWLKGTIDAAGVTGPSTSLTVDGGGRVHVSYTNGYLQYGTSCPGVCAGLPNWRVARVDADGGVGFYNSLAVDGTGGVHVSYYDSTNADLKYATCAADCATVANWTKVAVDVAGDVGRYTSMAVDGTGRVHVSYWDATNQVLKYATCAVTCGTAASWMKATVDAAGAVGRFSSIAVDGMGRVHVSYYDDTNADLKYME